MPKKLLLFFAAAVTTLLLCAAEAPRSLKDGVFSPEQVARGKKSYEAECADCHGEKLEGIDKAPALVGATFAKNWNGKTVFRLIDITRRNMPPDDPGTYKRELIADVSAYILSENGFPAGKADLLHDAPDLRQILIYLRK